MAPKGESQHSANLGYDHGKAVLCSNIHQRGNTQALYKYVRLIRRMYEAMPVRWTCPTRTPNQRP